MSKNWIREGVNLNVKSLRYGHLDRMELFRINRGDFSEPTNYTRNQLQSKIKKSITSYFNSLLQKSSGVCLTCKRRDKKVGDVLARCFSRRRVILVGFKSATEHQRQRPLRKRHVHSSQISRYAPSILYKHRLTSVSLQKSMQSILKQQNYLLILHFLSKPTQPPILQKF